MGTGSYSAKHKLNLCSLHSDRCRELLMVNPWAHKTCLLLRTNSATEPYTLIHLFSFWLQKSVEHKVFYHLLCFTPKSSISTVPKISTLIPSNLCQPRCLKFQVETFGSLTSCCKHSKSLQLPLEQNKTPQNKNCGEIQTNGGILWKMIYDFSDNKSSKSFLELTPCS